MKKRMEYKKIFLTIFVLIILFGIIILYNLQNRQEIDENIGGCQVDSDCVPSSCCHSSSCVLKEQEPVCEGIFCSMSCEGPLDCGAGHCGCVKNKCEVVED